MFDYAKISKIIEYNQECIESQKGERVLDDTRPELANLSGGTRPWEIPWVLERLSNLPKGCRVLDIGSGMSSFPVRLYENGWQPLILDFYVGDDPIRSGYGLTRAQARFLSDKTKIISGTMEHIPLADESVDAITSISVIEHIVIECRGQRDIIERCLSEARRVLRPGGLLVFTYDTTIDQSVIYDWDYAEDINFLSMDWQVPGSRVLSRNEILSDEDVFFVPPAEYIAQGYCLDCLPKGLYHRLTSIGFALVKP